MDSKELRGIMEAYSQMYAPQEDTEQLDEISYGLALRASKAADIKRGKLAHAGDKEGASEKAAQAARLYKKQAAKRLNRENFELWVNSLVEEGYDLSDYTWDEMYEFYLDEDAGIVSGLVGLALGAKGAYHAAKKTKRMRDYPKNFVKGIADPRTYVPKKKKEQKEEFELWVNALVEEGYDLSDYTWDEMYEFYLDEGVIDFVKSGVERHKSAMKGAKDAKKRHDAGVKKLGKTVKPVVDDAKKAAKKGGEIAGAVGRGIKAAAELERKGAAAVHAAGRKMKAAKKAVMSTEDLEFIAQYVIDEGYDLSDYTWEEFAEICESIDIILGEGNPIARFLSNRKHRLRDTEKGHEDIMRRNKEYQTKGKGPGGYRNKGAGRVEKVREEYMDEAQEARNNPEKYEREQSKKSAPVRGERTPMPPRGDKRREDFEKWYAKQMGR